MRLDRILLDLWPDRSLAAETATSSSDLIQPLCHFPKGVTSLLDLIQPLRHFPKDVTSLLDLARPLRRLPKKPTSLPDRGRTAPPLPEEIGQLARPWSHRLAVPENGRPDRP
jgi:hypothetical protein